MKINTKKLIALGIGLFMLSSPKAFCNETGPGFKTICTVIDNRTNAILARPFLFIWKEKGASFIQAFHAEGTDDVFLFNVQYYGDDQIMAVELSDHTKDFSAKSWEHDPSRLYVGLKTKEVDMFVGCTFILFNEKDKK